MEVGVTTILVFFVVFILSYILLRGHKDLPPGPVSLPLLGSIGFLWKSSKSGLLPHVTFAQAAQKYGSIFGIRFGPKLVVVLNGYDSIRKAFVDQAYDFIDRPNWLPQVQADLKYGKGISFSNGEEWRKIRKFCLQHLRSYGFGTDVMEERINEEVKKVEKVLLETKSELITIGKTFQYAVSNVICSMVFGQVFQYDDPTFQAMIEMGNLVLIGQGFISVTNFIPEFMYPLFPREYEHFKRKRKNTEELKEAIEKLIKSHEETFDGSVIRDLLDYYIKVKRGETKEENLANEPYFNHDNIYRIIFDIFLAGTETTSTALEWSLLYLIEYPHIQQKCRQQILDVVGDRQVRLSDRGNLPYVDAFIQEVLRLCNVIPLGVPRANEERDIFIDGLRIPKRTTILANLYSAHTDPKYWSSPLEFNPERFLNEKGQLKKNEAFIPLSIGPRNCPGDSLARMELFLFLTTLLQRFDFERDADAPPNDFAPRPDQIVTLVPNKFSFTAKARYV